MRRNPYAGLSFGQSVSQFFEGLKDCADELVDELHDVCVEEIKGRGSSAGLARSLRSVLPRQSGSGERAVRKIVGHYRYGWENPDANQDAQPNCKIDLGDDACTNLVTVDDGAARARAGSGKAKKDRSKSDDGTYALEFLNTSVNWAEVMPRLGRNASGCFCFYGPPGTGKTALAAEIARTLDRPLMVRRGSDFLSRHVGKTEGRIAKVFAEAAQRKAVLVIDEIDGMLFDRSEAQRSWELTQVNELLCHMEDYAGLFICTTNAFNWLDKAALRRFSLKCEFKNLRPDQGVKLFDRWLLKCPTVVSLEEKQSAHDAVRRLGKLTPGDFAAAYKRFQLFGESWNAADFATQLKNECDAKGVESKAIGFLQT